MPLKGTLGRGTGFEGGTSDRLPETDETREVGRFIVCGISIDVGDEIIGAQRWEITVIGEDGVNLKAGVAKQFASWERIREWERESRISVSKKEIREIVASSVKTTIGRG